MSATKGGGGSGFNTSPKKETATGSKLDFSLINNFSEAEAKVSGDGDENNGTGGETTVEIVGACKLMDGFFLGDAICAEDFDFLRLNKITHVVNCASDYIDNCFSKKGIKYYPLKWKEFQPVDLTEEVTNGIYNFVTNAHNDYQGVLIHSVNGRNRCCIAALIVLMQRFRWGLVKSLEFINAKKPGLEMTASLLKKLLQFESRLEKDHIKVLTKDWSTIYEDGAYYHEETIVTNSFKNSQKAETAVTSFVPQKRSRRRGYGVRWREQNEIFDIQEIKENIEGATKQKAEATTPQPQKQVTLQSQPEPASSKKMDDLITNVNEDDLKERDNNFADEDDVQPLVLGGDTYSELFDKRKPPKERKPTPSIQEIIQVKTNMKTQEDISAQREEPPKVQQTKKVELQQSPQPPPTTRIQDFRQKYTQSRDTSPPPQSEDGQFFSNGSPRIHKDHHHEAVRGPYLNPMRTSQEKAMRLSQYKETEAKKPVDDKPFKVDQISQHSYFKKGNDRMGNGTAFGATNPEQTAKSEVMNTSVRYNPVKFIKDPKKQLMEQTNEDVAGDEGSAGGNTAANFFNGNSIKKDNYPSSLQVPDNSFNKASPILIENRGSSYLDTIKEESDARRTRFYKSNLAMIYSQQNGGVAPMSVSNSGMLDPLMMNDDRGSVKSDQIHPNEGLALMAGNRSSLMLKQPTPQRNALPLLPKVREEATMGRTHSLPDNVLLQEEKLRQQANLRMQTRLHFLQQKEQQKQTYFSHRTQSLTTHITQQQQTNQYPQQPLYQQPYQAPVSQRLPTVGNNGLENNLEQYKGRSISPTMLLNTVQQQMPMGMGGNYYMYSNNNSQQPKGSMLPAVNDYGLKQPFGIQQQQHPGVAILAAHHRTMENNTPQAAQSGRMPFKAHIMEEFTQSRRIAPEGIFGGSQGNNSYQVQSRMSPSSMMMGSQLPQNMDDQFKRNQPFKVVNNYQETTKQVIALSTEKRRIL